MKLQEIDSALAEWNNRLAAIAKNLLELQADSTYQLLTGSGGAAKLALTGVTAARVEPSLGAMLTIFQHFGLLHGVIDQAMQLRAGLPAMFGGEAKAAEIRRLLGERTIRLPALDVPMDQKTLLSGGGAGGVLFAGRAAGNHVADVCGGAGCGAAGGYGMERVSRGGRGGGREAGAVWGGGGGARGAWGGGMDAGGGGFGGAARAGWVRSVWGAGGV